MIRTVASQQSPLTLGISRGQPRRSGTTELPRSERSRNAPDFPGRPGTTPYAKAPNAPVRRLRLVGVGDDPARKTWRLQMDTTDMAIQLPGEAGGLRNLGRFRLWVALHTGLALLGLMVVLAATLAATLPGPRDAALRELAAWADSWEEQNTNVTAGTIQPGVAIAPEQRALTEFIAKRYRVALDATSGYVATAFQAGSVLKVDPLLILAVMAVESRYNPVAESHFGAKGLMQVIPRFHSEKLAGHGGEGALLDPQVNIQVGAQILREYLRRFGETETALQMYAGAFDEPTSAYAGKVLAERARLEQLLRQVKRAAS